MSGSMMRSTSFADRRLGALSWAFCHMPCRSHISGQFGRGDTIGENVVIDIDDDDYHDIHSVSVATGEGSQGEWEFIPQEDGEGW